MNLFFRIFEIVGVGYFSNLDFIIILQFYKSLILDSLFFFLFYTCLKEIQKCCFFGNVVKGIIRSFFIYFLLLLLRINSFFLVYQQQFNWCIRVLFVDFVYSKIVMFLGCGVVVIIGC